VQTASYLDKIVGENPLSSAENPLPPPATNFHDAVYDIANFERQFVILLSRIVMHHHSFNLYKQYIQYSTEISQKSITQQVMRLPYVSLKKQIVGVDTVCD